MTKRWDILGFGAVAVDDLLYVDGFPSPDSKTQVREHRRDGGGLTGTALVAAARLGATTAYCGVLGDDELSRFTLNELHKEGVDCATVLHRDGARPHRSVVIVDRTTGQRRVLAMHDGVQSYPPNLVTEDLIAACRVLFLDHHDVETGLRAAELAHEHTIPVVADIERLTPPRIMDLIAQVDHLIINANLGRELTGRDDPPHMLDALRGGNATCYAVTDGARGCWHLEAGGEVRHVPAFNVPVVDTTGCGDVFHGAYAAAIARGDTIADAILVAAASAALKATQPGGRQGIPDRATVEDFLRNESRGGRVR